MKITIDLEETGYPSDWSGDPDHGSTFRGTIQEAIVAEAARQLLDRLGEEPITEIRREVSKARQAAVKQTMTPIVERAMREPLQRTSEYGHPVGDPVTMQELIVESVKEFLSERVEDKRSRRHGDRTTRAQAIVADLVEKTVAGELKSAVDKAKEAAVDVVRDEAAKVVTENLRRRLGAVT